jgi:transcriptional regulator with XRE-family HTH domain
MLHLFFIRLFTRSRLTGMMRAEHGEENRVGSTAIGRRIKTRRVLSWMSREEFADRVGVSSRQVAYWESGGDAPSAARIAKICQVLQVSTDWLLTGRGHEILDTTFYKQRQRAHLDKFLRAKQSIRLFTELPFDLKARKVQTIAALPEDLGAVALRMESDAYSPVYQHGDTLLLHPLNFRADFRSPAQRKDLVALHEKPLALTFNGENNIRIFELTAETGSGVQARLHPVAPKTSLTRSRTISVCPEDKLFLHGAIYKCVRHI